MRLPVKLLYIFLISISGILTGCQSRYSPVRETSSHYEIPTIQGPVRSLVDIWGIPHIYASQKEDAAFALGWFHARDRWVQMDLSRRTGSGRRAELLGSEALASDRLAHLLNLPRAQELAWASVPVDSEEHTIILAYSAGVNQYLGTLKPKDYPSIYTESQTRPEKWKPQDCFAVYQELALRLSFSLQDLKREILRFHLKDKLDSITPKEASKKESYSLFQAQLYPYPNPIPTAVPHTDAWKHKANQLATQALDTPLAQGFRKSSAPSNARPKVLTYRKNFADHVDLLIEESQEKPILKNPYLAHLHSPLMSIIGWSQPGIPAILMGHNGEIAWAFNVAKIDGTDFYSETLNAKEEGHYLYEGNWKVLQKREVKIKVLGKPNEKMTVVETLHGPLWSNAENQQALSVSWIGTRLGPGPSFLPFLRIHEARTWQDFQDALRDHSSPPLGFVFADRSQNMGLRLGGALPFRLQGSPLVILDGSQSVSDWRGTIPFQELPAAFNPQTEFFYLGQQTFLDPQAGYPYYLGEERPPNFKAQRLTQDLAKIKATPSLKLDQILYPKKNPLLELFLPHLLEGYLSEQSSSLETQLTLRMLQGWNGILDEQRIEPTLAFHWLAELEERVWGKEWQRVPELKAVPYPDKDVLLSLLNHHPNSPWFDDPETPETEDRNQLIRICYDQVIQKLMKQEGLPVANWRWAKFKDRFIDKPRSQVSQTIFNLAQLEESQLILRNLPPFKNQARSEAQESGGSPLTDHQIIPLRPISSVGLFPDREVFELITFHPPYRNES